MASQDRSTPRRGGLPDQGVQLSDPQSLIDKATNGRELHPPPLASPTELAARRRNIGSPLQSLAFTSVRKRDFPCPNTSPSPSRRIASRRFTSSSPIHPLMSRRNTSTTRSRFRSSMTRARQVFRGS